VPAAVGDGLADQALDLVELPAQERQAEPRRVDRVAEALGAELGR
jgi:hypothetical protein